MSNSATGPGALTEDGCAVDLYRRLVAGDEPEHVAAAVPNGATVLELGAGAGRVTHALLATGYRVTAVDSSADMLAYVSGAETVHAHIETLALGRTFDAVLLASNLINTCDETQRRAFLDTCRRHVARGGVVVLERYVPENVRKAKTGLLEEDGGIRCSLQDLTRRGKDFSATIVYEAADASWTQSFYATVLDDHDIEQALRGAGLSFGRWLDAAKGWLTATPT